MLEGAKRKKNRTGEKLRRQGFDRTTFNRSTGYYRVRCSQCQAAVINGMAAHETGCPNEKRESR